MIRSGKPTGNSSKYINLANLQTYENKIKELTAHIIEDISKENSKHKAKQTNCPNCGAVITGMKCEYCGTIF